MENDFSLEPLKKRLPAEVRALGACNAFSSKYGLVLSDKQLENLVVRRYEALRENGRVEFGEGIVKKLIIAFCDSPYIGPLDWEETLLELQDAFYFYKNEADELLSDDELIDYMKQTFNGAAQGSLEYLTQTSLEELCRTARNGFIGDVENEDEDESL